jgi:ATP synthase protein I
MGERRVGLGRPIWTAIRRQALATAALVLVAALWVGVHGAASAALGGMISITAGLVAAYIATRRPADSAGGILYGALRAEGVRVVLIVLLLWLVLATYRDIVAVAFFVSFALTLLIFSSALFMRDE